MGMLVPTCSWLVVTVVVQPTLEASTTRNTVQVGTSAVGDVGQAGVGVGSCNITGEGGVVSSGGERSTDQHQCYQTR